MTETPQYRMTRQRKLILETLRHALDHLSADEVYEIVRQEMPRISLGTVYRNLEILHEQGEIRKLEFGGTQSRWDGDPHPHYHIRCLCCDRIDNVRYEPARDVEASVSTPGNFRVVGHHLEFIGMCQECDANLISPGLGKLNKNQPLSKAACALKHPRIPKKP